jgi:hypothetical protein
MGFNSSPRKINQITVFLKSFCFLAMGLGIASFLLFNGVKLINGDNPYNSVLHINMFFKWHNFREIDKQPFPYLLTIVLISSVIGGIWTAIIIPKIKLRSKYQILIVPWISLIITSPIWGVIWSINLRSPQYFVDHFSNDPKAVMWLYYRTDAVSGLNLGWLSALQSFPINILSYTVFCFLLWSSRKLFSNVNAIKNDIVSKAKLT